MLRKPRIELPGGLYHVISRGNNRKKIFRSADGYLTFTETMASQKSKLSFYPYAYCLSIEELLSVAQRMSGLSREGLCSNSQAERSASSEGGSDRAGEAKRHTEPATGSGAGLAPSPSHKTVDAARSRRKN
jgi:hypothetical protein